MEKKSNREKVEQVGRATFHNIELLPPEIESAVEVKKNSAKREDWREKREAAVVVAVDAGVEIAVIKGSFKVRPTLFFIGAADLEIVPREV